MQVGLRPPLAFFYLRTKVGCRQRRRAQTGLKLPHYTCKSEAERSPVLREKLRMATHWPEARTLARSGSSLMLPVPGHWQKKVEGRPAASGRAGPPAPPMAHPTGRGKTRRARPRWALAGPQGPMAWPPVSIPSVDFKFPGRVGSRLSLRPPPRRTWRGALEPQSPPSAPTGRPLPGGYSSEDSSPDPCRRSESGPLGTARAHSG